MPDYVDPPVPDFLLPSFRELYRFCARLDARGWRPDFVLDIGASTGIWSGTVSEVFKDARYLLCDPLFSRYRDPWVKPNQERLEVAIADKPGVLALDVSEDLYGSSVIAVDLKDWGVRSDHTPSRISVPVTTVDAIVADRKLMGRCLIKADVQFAEHLVIEGALKTLHDHCDFIILELSVERVAPGALDMLEVMRRLDELGFRITDVVDVWRSPETGEALQFDIAFVRKGLRLARQTPEIGG